MTICEAALKEMNKDRDRKNLVMMVRITSWLQFTSIVIFMDTIVSSSENSVIQFLSLII